MTVRDAKFAEIPQIADLLVEAHGRSRYAGTDVQVDVRETKALLSRSIQRHGGEHIGSTLVLVAQTFVFAHRTTDWTSSILPGRAMASGAGVQRRVQSRP